MIKDEYAGRMACLRDWMRGALLDTALVTSLTDIRYLSGFTGSAGLLLVMPDDALLMSDGRYSSQAGEQCTLPFREYSRADRYPVLVEALEAYGTQVLGYQDGSMTARELHMLEKLLPDIAMEPMGDVLLTQRRVKSAEEIELIAQAARITDEAFARVLPSIREGMEEREVALMLDVAMRELGASGAAFTTVVATGAHGALPHAEPGTRKLAGGDLVVMDFGAIYEGYCADMTRTIGVGNAGKEAESLYALVLEAQLAGLDALQSGVKASEVDAAARRVIEKAGYGNDFVHGLGHGAGLAVHELPLLNPSAQDILLEGMVVTIEPGIYLKGKLGIRIEDLCVVRKNGCERLSTTPRELLVV